jgi:signal transduction histidine kinase
MLPKSLFGRMVLILVVGLVVAEGVSAALHFWHLDRIFSRTSASQAAQRIADIVSLLDTLEPAGRGKVVAILNTRKWFASLDPTALQPAAVETQKHQGLAEFEELVRRTLGGRELSVMLALQDAAGPSYVVQTRLLDGQLVTLGYRRDVTASPDRLPWTWPIPAAAIIVMMLSAVRWVTRPLSILANAAEELGRDINRPPLAEIGPSEVRRAAQAFNIMQSRLARLIQDRARIFSAMSHDLKTSITRLRLRTELLEDAELKTKFATDLELMSSMVNATLDFMRGMENQEMPQPVDIMALLESIQADAEEVGQPVTVAGNTVAPFTGKPQALKRCIGNLVDNAVKYGNHATIMVNDDAERLEIRIRDCGPGIPEQELEKVFAPFYRLEGSRSRESGGTGLELSIARNLARLHGGDITLRNLAGGGLEADLTLPRGAFALPSHAGNRKKGS